jgi:hypothetical protein
MAVRERVAGGRVAVGLAVIAGCLSAGVWATS